ncbi:MAG: peptide-methionine (S)-S-oxide reductase [Candidatus Pacebacteria bacterium CG10_big_fil_rev_8_21_14_0_10_44_54]|nr:peptide-methionine (S)-S-oxide reductase MsrA [bacterium]PIR60298.1 MAG: peptide-methionine (S)-S-oxide reductase [Candidatus Pacebacteria bacterium CG10_big_fil_rev_8_21_14_0_10_44_54]
MKSVVFGGGCFWCTEAVFQNLKGVTKVFPGYAGGNRENPTYEQVATGVTGHAEVIQISYDPTQISFQDLLLVFFATHDASQLNRQGYDEGSEHRSLIYFTTKEQEKLASAMIQKLQANGKKVVTELKPLAAFYPAEVYHHNYYKLNSEQPYCQFIIVPKLEKLWKEFGHLYAEK